MLIALFTFLLLGGSGSGPTIESLKEAERAVTTVVAEESRQEAAVGVIREMAEVVREFGQGRTEAVKAFERAGRSYEASSKDLLAVIEPERDKTLELQDRLVKLHSELKTHLTAEEWALMYRAIRKD